MADNQVALVGNATRDPELRYTSGGRGVVSFGLAVNRRYQQNNEWVEQVSFLDVTAWGTLGENVAASISKGMRTMVIGRLEQRSWENEAGEKRSKVEIIADAIGPDLRWAMAQVEKTERTKPSRADDGYEGTARQSSGQGGGGQSYQDEEPF